MRRRKKSKRPPMTDEQKAALWRRSALSAIERGVVSPYDVFCALLKQLPPTGDLKIEELVGA